MSEATEPFYVIDDLQRIHDETEAARALVCTCYWTDSKYWTTHYGATEPGSQMEPNPDCPVHFRDAAKLPGSRGTDVPQKGSK